MHREDERHNMRNLVERCEEIHESVIEVADTMKCYKSIRTPLYAERTKHVVFGSAFLDGVKGVYHDVTNKITTVGGYALPRQIHHA
jgi:hypothetical protein